MAGSPRSIGCRCASTLTRVFPRNVLMPLYAEAQIGLVTPLRDGMNLVAKEYAAAQDPEDPGVLVLSQFAGAAGRLVRGRAGQSVLDEAGIAAALDRGLGDAARGALRAPRGDVGSDAAEQSRYVARSVRCRSGRVKHKKVGAKPGRCRQGPLGLAIPARQALEPEPNEGRMHIEISPLHPLFAAEVRHGIDATRKLGPTTRWPRSRPRWIALPCSPRVRDQRLTDEQLGSRSAGRSASIEFANGTGISKPESSGCIRHSPTYPMSAWTTRYWRATTGGGSTVWAICSGTPTKHRSKPVPAKCSILSGRVVATTGGEPSSPTCVPPMTRSTRPPRPRSKPWCASTRWLLARGHGLRRPYRERSAQ